MPNAFVLDRSAPPLGTAGAIALAASGRLRGVDHLDLTGQWIGFDGLKAILAAVDVRSLLHLEIADCGLESEGAQLLAETTAFSPVATLTALTVPRA